MEDLVRRIDALEAVTVELLGGLWAALGEDVAMAAVRRTAEDVIPPGGQADIYFSNAVAKLLVRIEHRVAPR